MRFVVFRHRALGLRSAGMLADLVSSHLPMTRLSATSRERPSLCRRGWQLPMYSKTVHERDIIVMGTSYSKGSVLLKVLTLDPQNVYTESASVVGTRDRGYKASIDGLALDEKALHRRTLQLEPSHVTSYDDFADLFAPGETISIVGPGLDARGVPPSAQAMLEQEHGVDRGMLGRY